MRAPDPNPFRLLDYVPNGCCILAEDGRIVFWNRTLATWTRRTAEEVTGRNLYQVFPDLQHPRFRERIQEVFVSGAPALFSAPLNPQFFPCTRPDGRPRIQQTALNRLPPSADRGPLVLLSVSDVTDPYERGDKYRAARSQAMEEARVRRESEIKHRTVVDLSSDGILTGRIDGTIQDANTAAGLLFRCAPEALTGGSLLDRFASEHGVAVHLAIELESGTEDRHLELQGRRMDGSFFPAELSVKRFVVDGEAHFVAYVRDITERRRSEEALRQAQKQESLGILAGGIAHDFNNLLGAVLGNLELVYARTPEDAPILPYLKHLESEVSRAADLSRKMLAFSGKSQARARELNLNAFLAELRPLLQATVQRRADLHYDCQEGLPSIEADEEQIQQAILALVNNASEALGEREGVISLETEARQVDVAYIAEHFRGQGLHPGRHVLLRVADTGCGIPPEALPRIFDPFYTTKFSGRGLSLSVVLGILRGHKAAVQVASSGKGTTFTIAFPVLPASRQITAAEPEPTSDQGQPLGQILVVDDEEVLRETTAELLQDLGYSVATAADGRQAVDYYAAHLGKVALVLMDITMPRMDGKAAFLAIRELDPSARVLLMSGYSEHDLSQAIRERGLAGFLPKPFRLAQLREAIRKALPREP